jgi:hypothetical protein
VDLQCYRNVLVPIPKSVPRPYLRAQRTIPSMSLLGFCSDMHCGTI